MQNIDGFHKKYRKVMFLASFFKWFSYYIYVCEMYGFSVLL